MKKSYVANVTGWINGAHRIKGRSVGELTDDEAKYLVQSGQIIEKEAAEKAKAERKAEPDPATLDMKTGNGKVERTR
ncbi:protein of unknown function [Pseudorhizobium banfieldiae]|uniref:Uncharacterized protein n=1 Tax=Pseudorhizobium banfieldiae TaxID=1125847 RepID=L0NDJ4_9HYPH|nr:hypothetical protein [Pseudorhizobium banfieldiae]CAD6606233.1 hypothetical protein RNT25_01818 [arsenite-oxidising bacterium NT-25]CCF19163.1 protein of unknown function [Pseudorhizobium banfieldiae]